MSMRAAEGFDNLYNLYNTLDLFATESPDTLTYSLVIHTFCEIFVEDLGWS